VEEQKLRKKLRFFELSIVEKNKNGKEMTKITEKNIY
jgi:hypothetical protein